MEEILIFETAVTGNSRFNVVSSNGKEWLLEEKWWSDNDDLVHEITLEKKVKIFLSQYYVDVEASLVGEFESYLCKPYRVNKSFKASSDKIKFKMYENEYNSLISNPVERATSKQFRIKIILSPILQFINEQKIPKIPTVRKHKKKKPTKGHLIEELRNLAHDIHSLINDGEGVTADVILYCGKMSVKSHRAVLSARSPRFRKLFLRMAKEDGDIPRDFKKKGTQFADYIPAISKIEDTIEHNRNPVVIFNPLPNSEYFCEIFLDDIDESIFKDFMDFIYSGMINKCEFEKAKELYYAAVFKYGMKDFEIKCLPLFKELLNEKTASDVLDFIRSVDNKKLIEVHSEYEKRLRNARENEPDDSEGENESDDAEGENESDDAEGENEPGNAGEN